MPKRNTDPILDRLAAQTNFLSQAGCWTWLGHKTVAGYGQIQYDLRAHYTHRISYALLVGPLVEGLEIDHLCRNRACWNPVHLEQVTHAENCRRGEAGGSEAAAIRAREVALARAAAATHCGKGHARTPENTYTYPYGRQCKLCLREAKRQRRARKSVA